MNRDDFFQTAMLKMAEVILLRTDKEPTPEQLADKAKKYAVALHNAMLAGALECDIYWMHSDGAPAPPEDAFDNGEPPSPRPVAPVLHPGGRFEHVADPSCPPCPKCGGEMRRRDGRNGPFYGCTLYPQCRGTLNLR